MKVCIITGSSGLIGSQAVEFFSSKFDVIVGIDNNQRAKLFGPEASTDTTKNRLIEKISNFVPVDIDIRYNSLVNSIFNEFKDAIKLIIHCAAQPSHDWAAKDPHTDFEINANGTLNLLEATRQICPEAVFIFTSTNKVYGDLPNILSFQEGDTRYDLSISHEYFNGLNETTPIDQSMHSLFGVSKLSADLMVQEYGRYFGMQTGVFRGGCLTGPNHAGAPMHGFLSYLMKCAINKQKYNVNGYLGKQVRDNIHSFDLVNMFNYFYENPRFGEVYNAGGGRHSNCSLMEAVEICQEISGNKIHLQYCMHPRKGDHIWWISDVSKFKSHYPGWHYKYSLFDTLEEIFQINKIK